MSLQTSLELLTHARKLIADEKSWTKGTLARDAFGQEISADDPKACKFCAVGAIERATCDLDAVGQLYAVRVLRDTLGLTTNIPEWNDDDARTHAEVLAGFDAAIQNVTARLRALPDGG